MYQRPQRTDELYHHGVKGQKWGVRRYQNPDGTLTAKGKKHKEAMVNRLSLLQQGNKYWTDDAKMNYEIAKEGKNYTYGQKEQAGRDYLLFKEQEYKTNYLKDAIVSDAFQVGKDYTKKTIKGHLGFEEPNFKGAAKDKKDAIYKEASNAYKKDNKKTIKEVERFAKKANKDIERIIKERNITDPEEKELLVAEYYEGYLN